MNPPKPIEAVEGELNWYASQQAIEGKAAALAGVAMLHAVREFDRSSTKLGNRMWWLSVVIGVLTAMQIVLALIALLQRR